MMSSEDDACSESVSTDWCHLLRVELIQEADTRWWNSKSVSNTRSMGSDTVKCAKAASSNTGGVRRARAFTCPVRDMRVLVVV